MNPRIGSGMQQARNRSSGGSRRGGAKPRGRNELRRWNFEAEASDFRVERGSGRCNGMSMEGQQAHPGGTSVPTVCGRTGRMAVESAGTMGMARIGFTRQRVHARWSAKARRFASSGSFGNRAGERSAGDTPRMSLVTGNIEGGAGKSNRPAPRTERAFQW